MAAFEAQHVVNLSLKKILASRSRRGGIDLHRNLLLASVLLKARDACLVRTCDPCYHGDAGNQDNAAPLDANNDDDDVNSLQDDVRLASDAVPNCDETSEKECLDGAQVRWDVIPDQALEEWDFLGPDISTEQLDPVEEHKVKSDIKRQSDENGEAEAVTELPGLDVADVDLCTSSHSSSISRKRTYEIELGLGGSDDNCNVPLYKKQKTDQTLNCEKVCMDFDDLINSLEGNCSITNPEVLDSSDDFVNHLGLSLDSTCDSSLCSVNDKSSLLTCQSSAGNFMISLNDVSVV